MEGQPIHEKAKRSMVYYPLLHTCPPWGISSGSHWAPANVRCAELIWPCLCSLAILFIPKEGGFALFCCHLIVSLSLRLLITHLFSWGKVTVGDWFSIVWYCKFSHRANMFHSLGIHSLLSERLSSLHTTLGHLFPHY